LNILSFFTGELAKIFNIFFVLYVYGSVYRWSILIIVQGDAKQSSLFIILQVHCTCFGCRKHPSSGVHKTVTTASGTGLIFYAATSLQRGQVLAWPRWREVAAFGHIFCAATSLQRGQVLAWPRCREVAAYGHIFMQLPPSNVAKS